MLSCVRASDFFPADDNAPRQQQQQRPPRKRLTKRVPAGPGINLYLVVDPSAANGDTDELLTELPSDRRTTLQIAPPTWSPMQQRHSVKLHLSRPNTSPVGALCHRQEGHQGQFEPSRFHDAIPAGRERISTTTPRLHTAPHSQRGSTIVVELDQLAISVTAHVNDHRSRRRPSVSVPSLRTRSSSISTRAVELPAGDDDEVSAAAPSVCSTPPRYYQRRQSRIRTARSTLNQEDLKDLTRRLQGRAPRPRSYLDRSPEAVIPKASLESQKFKVEDSEALLRGRQRPNTPAAWSSVALPKELYGAAPESSQRFKHQPDRRKQAPPPLTRPNHTTRARAQQMVFRHPQDHPQVIDVESPRRRSRVNATTLPPPARRSALTAIDERNTMCETFFNEPSVYDDDDSDDDDQSHVDGDQSRSHHVSTSLSSSTATTASTTPAPTARTLPSSSSPPTPPSQYTSAPSTPPQEETLTALPLPLPMTTSISPLFYTDDHSRRNVSAEPPTTTSISHHSVTPPPDVQPVERKISSRYKPSFRSPSFRKALRTIYVYHHLDCEPEEVVK